MNTPQTTPTISSSHTHPLILTAAAAVTIASGVVIANLAGWLPHSKPEAPQATQTAAQTTTVTAEPAPVAPAPVAAAKPATQKVGAGETAPKAQKAPPPVHKVPATAAVNTPSYRLPPPPPPAAAPEMARAAPPLCRDCGTIEAIEEVPVEGKAGAGGAIAGGVVGSVIGNQIGEGSGRTVARLLGMAGGAYVGHQIEKSGNKSVRYDITVRFEDGTSQRVSSATPPAWRSGDKVRIQNGEIVPRN